MTLLLRTLALLMIFCFSAAEATEYVLIEATEEICCAEEGTEEREPATDNCCVVCPCAHFAAVEASIELAPESVRSPIASGYASHPGSLLEHTSSIDRPPCWLG